MHASCLSASQRESPGVGNRGLRPQLGVACGWSPRPGGLGWAGRGDCRGLPRAQQQPRAWAVGPPEEAAPAGWRAIWRRKRKLARAQVALAAPAGGSANRGRKRSLVAAAVTERGARAGARRGKGGADREPRAGWRQSRRRELGARLGPGGARRTWHGEEVAGRGGGGAGLLRARRQRGEPQAQPERQPGQVCRVVEKVKFQAGIHEARGTPFAADAGEWPGSAPGSVPRCLPPSLPPSARAARALSMVLNLPPRGARARGLAERLLSKVLGAVGRGKKERLPFLPPGEGLLTSARSLQKKKWRKCSRGEGLTVGSVEFCN